jgi:hypothetical protein
VAEAVEFNAFCYVEQVADRICPAVRLVPASENRVEALLIRVASLERAKVFLREKQLLGVDAAGQVTIDPSKIGGLDLRLVES